MRNNTVVLLDALGGLLTALINIVCFTSLVNNQFLNYREVRSGEAVYSWIITALALYLLGFYTIALVMQQVSREERKIEPLFLLLGCILGLLIGSLVIYFYSLMPPLQQTLYSQQWVLFVPILLSILGFLTACRFKSSRLTSNPVLSVSRILVPSAIALTLIVVNNSDFPGVGTPAEVRQQWAYKEFGNYDGVVNSIKSCRSIIERVGNVKFVAPTQGKNYVVSDQGSSGHQGKLTLEVVGAKGTGVANSSFHISTDISYVRFTYQNKIEEFSCY